MGGPNWNSTHFTLSMPRVLRRLSITPCLRTTTWIAAPFCQPMRTSLGTDWAQAGADQSSEVVSADAAAESAKVLRVEFMFSQAKNEKWKAADRAVAAAHGETTQAPRLARTA